MTHSEEPRKKMYDSHTGIKQSAETIEKRVSKIRGKELPLKGKSIYTTESKIGCKSREFNYGTIKNKIVSNRGHRGWEIFYGQ